MMNKQTNELSKIESIEQPSTNISGLYLVHPEKFWNMFRYFDSFPREYCFVIREMTEVWPLGDDIILPSNISDEELVLIAWNLNPNAIHHMKNFLLTSEQIKSICKNQQNTYYKSLSGEEYVNVNILKNEEIARPLNNPVNLFDEICKYDGAQSLLRLVQKEFNGSVIDTESGLKFLIRPIKLRDERVKDGTNGISNLPYILISLEKLKKLLGDFKKQKQLPKADKYRKIAQKIHDYLKIHNTELLERCTTPAVAEAIQKAFCPTIEAESISREIPGIFKPGDKTKLRKEKGTDSIVKDLLKELKKIDFVIF